MSNCKFIRGKSDGILVKFVPYNSKTLPSIQKALYNNTRKLLGNPKWSSAMEWKLWNSLRTKKANGDPYFIWDNCCSKYFQIHSSIFRKGIGNYQIDVSSLQFDLVQGWSFNWYDLQRCRNKFWLALNTLNN